MLFRLLNIKMRWRWSTMRKLNKRLARLSAEEADLIVMINALEYVLWRKFLCRTRPWSKR